MLLSAIRRKGQPDHDLQPVQNPEHALVSNKQEGPARSWLTACSKPRACSCQQQAGTASQILTYSLLKAQSMLLLATSRLVQPDADLHAVQSSEHVLVSNIQKGQPDAALQSVQSPEHTLVSNIQEGPARCWLTCCSKPRAWSCQQQAERASQILTYTLFQTQSMILSATHSKSQQDADLHPVQNPEHAPVNNKQEGQPNPDLPTIHNQSMFSLVLSWDQLDVSLLPVWIYQSILSWLIKWGSHTICGKYFNISFTMSLFLLNSFQPEDTTLLSKVISNLVAYA